MRVKAILTAVLASQLAQPGIGLAQAQAPRRFEAPAGCTVYLTVQMRGCLVSNHFTCEGDAKGQHRLALADGGGLFAVNLFDAEFQWLENFFPKSGQVETLEQPAPDPASFSALLNSGRDEYSFAMTGADGTRAEFSGYDELSGGTVTIDGELLMPTTFSYVRRDAEAGTETEISGAQFVSRRFGLFFSGVETARGPEGEEVSTNFTPMTFSEPGEKGFAAAAPIFDCDTTLSVLPGGPALLPASVRR